MTGNSPPHSLSNCSQERHYNRNRWVSSWAPVPEAELRALVELGIATEEQD